MISLAAERERSRPESIQEPVTYGLIEKHEIADAGRIYCESFPHRVRKWFPKEANGAQAFGDLMELMRLTHGKSFLVARDQGQLIGYLILTLPHHSLFRAVWRERLIIRLLANALSGQYGLSPLVAGRALKTLFSVPTSRIENELADAPHIYVIAVDQRYLGKGIGSGLIENARLLCGNNFRRMWLNVELTNAGAIRFYERFGFRIVESDSFQHAMVWDFAAPGQQ